MAVKKTKPKKALKPKAGKVSLANLEKKAEQITTEITSIRKKIAVNEAATKAKITQRKKIESKINSLLRKNLANEKTMLTLVKQSASKKQIALKKKILSLEKINLVYVEKEARIKEAKKKQIALKRQLDLLESQVVV